MLEPLLPKDLTEKDAAFKTVEELHEVIAEFNLQMQQNSD